MWWPWRSCGPASQPEEEQEPAVGHRHLHIEHGDVETESTASEHWPELPVEEEVHVEDPAGDQTSSAGAVEAMAETPPEPDPWVMEEEEETSGDSDGEEGSAGSVGKRRRRRPLRRRRVRRRGGLPVCVAVGTAAAVMLLAIVAVVASWKRRQRRHGRPAAGAG